MRGIGWYKVRRWEIALFIAWWLVVIVLTQRVGGIPVDRTDVEGMYRVVLKGPAPDALVSPALYWAWTVATYAFAPYMIYFILKYAAFFGRARPPQ